MHNVAHGKQGRVRITCVLLFELSTCRSCLVPKLNINSFDLQKLATGTVLLSMCIDADTIFSWQSD